MVKGDSLENSHRSFCPVCHGSVFNIARQFTKVVNQSKPNNSLQPTALAGSIILGSAAKVACPSDWRYSANTVRRLNSSVMWLHTTSIGLILSE